MNKESNAYIFIYASVMVVLVAILLASANLGLSPYQEKNKQNEKMIKILGSVGIQATPADAEKIYNEHLVKEVVLNTKGEELSVYSKGKFEKGSQRAFDINLKAALKKIVKGEDGALPLFIFEAEGTQYYVIPMFGKGLWGPIYGNIALETDRNTVYGVNFAHDGETPGLGAEIANPPVEGKVVFADQFKQKKIFDEAGNFTSVKVVKGGVKSQTAVLPANGVDAISGSTLTCNGVSAMLNDNLKNYVNYFKNIK